MATPGQNPATAPSADAELSAEIARARIYRDGWAAQRARLGEYLGRFGREQGKVAMLGAGHLACTFINLLGLAEHIDCLVDDNPHKRGLYMPGSRLPILGSEALLERGIKLCLLSVNAEAEDKVIAKNRAYTEAGGIFRSIFPASRHALRP